MVAGLVLACVFLGLSLGYTLKRYDAQDSMEKNHGMVPELFDFVAAATIEFSRSLSFIGNVSLTATDRDVAWPMSKVQQRTAHRLRRVHRVFVERYENDVDDLNMSPFVLLPMGSLVGIQEAVIRRSATTKDLVQFFTNLQTKAVQLMSQFVAKETSKESLALYKTMRSAQLIARAGIDEVNVADIVSSGTLTDEHYFFTCRSKGDFDMFQHGARHMLSKEGDVAIANDFLRSKTSTSKVILGSLQQAAAWSVLATPSPSSKYLNMMTDNFQAISDNTMRTAPWRADIQRNNELCVAFVATALFIAFVILCVVVVRAVRAVMQEAQDAMETNQMIALESSYRRMISFVDAIATLNVKEIKIAEGKHVQPAERDVYTLEAPTRQLLGFLHPLLPSVRLVAQNATEGGDTSAPLPVAEIVPRHMRHAMVSLLFMDIDSWQSRVTSETAKTVPREYSTFLTRMTQMVEQNGGVIHEVSGSKIIAAWNLLNDCHDAESLACQAVQGLHKAWAGDYSNLRFAVVTGECSVGVAGTDTTKTFTVLGPILPLGALLMRLNRLHNTTCIVDDATFAKLDGQTFRTRPVEVVAVDSDSKKTVAFEMMLATSPTDKDGRNASWNEAFDEYKSGNIDRAKYLLRKWQSTFGETRSLLRLMQLLSEDPPRQCTVKLNDDGLLEDELL